MIYLSQSHLPNLTRVLGIIQPGSHTHTHTHIAAAGTHKSYHIQLWVSFCKLKFSFERQGTFRFDGTGHKSSRISCHSHISLHSSRDNAAVCNNQVAALGNPYLVTPRGYQVG
jgi:hypothetical protein